MMINFMYHAFYSECYILMLLMDFKRYQSIYIVLWFLNLYESSNRTQAIQILT